VGLLTPMYSQVSMMFIRLASFRAAPPLFVLVTLFPLVR
jgi:hypothetical protein